MMGIKVLFIDCTIATFLALYSADDAGGHLCAPPSGTLLSTQSVFSLVTAPSFPELAVTLVMLHILDCFIPPSFSTSSRRHNRRSIISDVKMFAL